VGSVRGRGVIIMIALYAAPIIAGVIMIAFMIKPLFARPADEGRTRFLTRQGEPVLFEFVDKLCASVGAPLPRRIEINNALNASASYGRGWRGLLGGDLVLTIGIPLAAGLSMEQFAGVLAHEFGHFSQGLGMRMTFIVRGISHWFVRVVYERDEWDAWLAESHQDTDWRWAIVMLCAQFSVWLGRRVLWVLMYIGHFVAGFLLRQMEYDADLHEARFVGSKVFEATSLRLRTLNKTYEAAINDLVGHLNKGKLPDNFSMMIMSHAAKLPAGAVARQREALEKEKTGLFDTHPCDKQRIAAAQRDGSEGVFRFEGPASLLFTDFETTCRSVTGDFYRGIFGSRFDTGRMLPTETLLAQ
jgi:Zn-dependent protease with chaperone function